MEELPSEKKDPKSQGHHFFRDTALYQRSYSEGFVFVRSHDYTAFNAEDSKELFDPVVNLSDMLSLSVSSQKSQKGRFVTPYGESPKDKNLDTSSLSSSVLSVSIPSKIESLKKLSEEALATKYQSQEPDLIQKNSPPVKSRRASISDGKTTHKTAHIPKEIEKRESPVFNRPRTISCYEIQKPNLKSSLSESQQDKPQFLRHFQNIYIDSSMRKHILRFVTEPQDMTSVGCLILAHEQFFSSEVLLGLLLNCFFDHSTDSPDDQVIQARILNFLKKWCKIAWPSLCFFKLVNVLEEFLTFLCDNQSKYYNTLQSAVSEAKAADQFQPPTLLNINVHTLSRIDKAGHCSFADSRSLDLAQQLTLIDWEFLRAVHLHELVRCRWIKDKAPTLLRASKRVNDLAYWIAFQVVTVNQLKKRIKVLIKIIRLAKHLLELKSFNSLMAIYLALNFPALARLTHTWENIGKRYLQQWKKISSILSPVRNFKEYHDLTDEMTPPMILCQEILLKDLLYYEQKSQFAAKGTLNLERIYQIGSLIDRFRETQKVEFPILKSSVMYNYLLQIPDWENSEIATDVLDGQSRHIEPGLT